MLLKITLGKQIHIYNGEIVIQSVKKFVRKAFKNVPREFSFIYIDHEGDSISLSTPQDLSMISSYQQSRIMKIYVQEEDIFQLISTEKSQSAQSCQTILIQDQVNVIQISKNFIQKIKKDAVNKLIEQQNQIIKEQTQNYLNDIAKKVSIKIEQEQIKKVVQLKKRNKYGRAKSVQKKQIKFINQDQISKKIDIKIKAILPSLISKIMKMVEIKITKINCIKCDRSEVDLQKLINKQLLNQYRCKINRFENPEV